MTSPQTSRARRTIAAAVLAAAALSGCSVNSPVQTDVQYVAGDGRPVDLGDIKVRNLLVVTGDSGPGTVSAGIANTGSRDSEVTITTDDGGVVKQAVKAGESVVLQAALGKVSTKPGDLVKLTVAATGAGEVPVSVPVLTQTGYYESVTPTPAPQGSSTASATN